MRILHKDVTTGASEKNVSTRAREKEREKYTESSTGFLFYAAPSAVPAADARQTSTLTGVRGGGGSTTTTQNQDGHKRAGFEKKTIRGAIIRKWHTDLITQNVFYFFSFFWYITNQSGMCACKKNAGVIITAE